ncbi:MAG: hypothetical protein AAFW89_12450 [Bacteroidota bacterium]
MRNFAGFQESIKSPVTKRMSMSTIDSIVDLFGLRSGSPVFSVLSSTLSNLHHLSNYIFTKRLYTFLNEIEMLSPHRETALWHILAKAKGEQAGEIILETISNLDSDEKAKLLGRLAAAVPYEKITPEVFFRLGHIIKSVYYEDLVKLSEHASSGYIENTSEALYNAGLIQIVDADDNTLNDPEFDGKRYRLTKLGRTLSEFLISNNN